jgi:hypothetical protein
MQVSDINRWFIVRQGRAHGIGYKGKKQAQVTIVRMHHAKYHRRPGTNFNKLRRASNTSPPL